MNNKSAQSGTGKRPIRILTFTTLFPNAAFPNHGVFVENRLRHLVATGRATSRVVAPVGFVPFDSPIFGAHAANARVPRTETRHGLSIQHPRQLIIPKIGMLAAPMLLYHAALPAIRSLQRDEDFDLIDAHYFYPDGIAATMLGRTLGKPVVITARGTDVNLIPQFKWPRRMIQKAAGRAAHLIAVSQAIKEAIVALDVPAEKVTVLRNGVDLVNFRPLDPKACRAKLDLSGKILLSVGLLIERKGHELIIDAMRTLPDFTLLIAGEGPDRPELTRQIAELGLQTRVRLLGAICHDRLSEFYSAADALVLASSREGWPNVLLEAMACGTPVVASNIWGNPEVVAKPEAGRLMPERSASGVAAGVKEVFANLPDRAATRRYAEMF
ncbi:MAG TPA: glycosyltransferase family 4 protein, partial [Pirellulales bacterium]|nr:glycosyltransferase family 4 protein [Pirellulales bacterium]